jgi:DNA repair exonuclease SbcCD nuclease subunit
MKIGIVGDIHWSKYSSILRSRGKKYSKRLENCIDSINWAEDTTRDCDMVVYLGDFFDHESLKSEEITALSEIKWNKLPHKFLVGNHELGLNDLSFSSAHIFDLKNPQVIDHSMTWVYSGVEICYLPYMLDMKESIEEYFGEYIAEKRIIFSHNDIAGVQMGKFVSTSGFDINDIEANCDLFINGHLHNGTQVSNKIYNIGNLTGQNFSEDAEVYKHNIFLLDTDTLEIEAFENPYALKFYKFIDLDSLMNYDFEANSIVTAKLPANDVDKAKEFVLSNEDIIAHRFIIMPNLDGNVSSIEHTSLTVNHLDKFQEFILEQLGSDQMVVEELGEVLK